ncbi:asparaginase [Umezawaea sp.]|uniref:asparaginase n=1 Tax=Umezawaea sp. TaxID=1955258 RepID=UPI002ED0DD61
MAVGKRVAVFGLGGTIAMVASRGGGAVPALSPEQLLAAVPGLGDVDVSLEVVDFRQVPGASVTFEDVAALYEAIRGVDVDGVVVTQGTDTIEETSYLLDLAYDGDMPIVVTGAMRNPTLAGADGPANLLAAIQVAAGEEARGQGCLVVFADEIHAARRVRKTHSSSPGTFRSPNGGPLGYVVEGAARMLQRVERRAPVPFAEARSATVAVVTAMLGDEGVLLEGVEERVDGVVVAAFGAGHVPVSWVEPLVRLVARIPVVLASRTGAGSVLEHTYGFSGSEKDLRERGLVSAGFLDPLKARLLLRQLLGAGADDAAIREAFREAGR